MEIQSPSADAILRLLEDNPIPSSTGSAFSGGSHDVRFFRLDAALLPPFVVRVALIGTLRSRQTNKATGIMITASEYGDSFNGVQLFDAAATAAAADGDDDVSLPRAVSDDTKVNEPNPFEFTQWFLTQAEKLPIDVAPVMHIGRDTRAHSESLANLAIAAAQAAGARVMYHSEITTPCLYHCVSCYNGVYSPYLVQSPPMSNEDGYYGVLARSYASLVQGTAIPETSLLVDCAGGVGYLALRQLVRALQQENCMRRIVPSNRPFSAPLNEQCGAHFVKTTRTPPVWKNQPPIGKDCCASLNGDATEVVFFSETNGFTILDDDKIVCLISHFLRDQLDALARALANAGKDPPSIRLGALVPTSFSEEALSYLQSCLGDGAIVIKTEDDLHETNNVFDVCVQLADPTEARASLRFDESFCNHMQNAEESLKGTENDLRSACACLKAVASHFHTNAISDGLSSLLLVDAILRLEDKTIHDWNAIY